MVVIKDAIYKDNNSMINTSPIDDWGWYCKDKEEDKLLIIRVVKKSVFSRKWEPEIIVGSEVIDDIKIDGVDVINKRPYEIRASIKIKNVWEPVTFDQECRISISYYENLKNKKNGTSENVKEETSENVKEENSENVIMSEVSLIPDSGYYSSYLFFMLGSTASGKSCWIYALNTSNVRNRAMRQYEPKSLCYCRENATLADTFLPTDITKIEFNDFTVTKNSDDPNKKLVFIVDLGGEVANSKAKDQKTIDRRNIVTRIRSLATGIFVVRNEKWLYEKQDAKANETDPAELLYKKLRIGEHPLLENQFCYILTGADRIQKAITEDTELGERLELASNSPIFSQAEDQKQMDMNMAITHSIMKKRDERIKTSPCFAVSNCGDTEDGKLDFKKNYNVELPFIYILKSFEI